VFQLQVHLLLTQEVGEVVLVEQVLKLEELVVQY
jgi:hypothetical protein